MKAEPLKRKPRILLLLPTRTYRASDFLSAAMQLNAEVVIGSDQPQTMETLSTQKSLLLRFNQPEQATQAIVTFAQAYPIDAIVGVDDDTVVLSAMASEALSLPHNPIESVYATRNKYQMRRILAEAGLPSPFYHCFSIDEEPEAIASRVPFPCVVKPISLSASRGVIRADDPVELVAAFQRIRAILQSLDAEDPKKQASQQVMVEGFIPGIEVAFEGLFSDGVLNPLAIFDKPDPLDGPFFEETLYITPSRLPDSAQRAIGVSVAQAAAAIGLQEGPIHAELRINDDGIWVVEIAARSIGGLCGRTLRFGIGISLEALIIRHALGQSIGPLLREENAAGVMMIPIPHRGILREIQGKDDAAAVEGIEDVTLSIPVGQEVVPLPEGNRYLGFIFARRQTPQQVEDALRKAHRRLQFVIEAAD